MRCAIEGSSIEKTSLEYPVAHCPRMKSDFFFYSSADFTTSSPTKNKRNKKEKCAFHFTKNGSLMRGSLDLSSEDPSKGQDAGDSAFGTPLHANPSSFMAFLLAGH